MSIAIVGEAWGRDEEQLQAPFVGASGSILLHLLADTGLLHLTLEDRANMSQYWKSGHDAASRNPYFNWLVWQAHPEIYATNVFNLRPRPTNDVKNLCGPKALTIEGYPALQQGKYVDARYRPELDRLFQDLTARSPTLIIAFGATPAWALLRSGGIKSIRGAPAMSEIGIKVLPTYHPAAVLRDWSLRPIVYADLIKAKREAQFAEVRRPAREVWIEPSIEDLDIFHRSYMMNAPLTAADIETIGDMITCIGFSPDPQHALVVPFFDPGKPDKNYWPSKEQELAAWRRVKRWCAELPLVFQNGLYDIHFLWRTMGIPVMRAQEDTMLLHHAMQPEMEKSLGFLGSIYTDEASWKFMRKHVGTIKRED